MSACIRRFKKSCPAAMGKSTSKCAANRGATFTRAPESGHDPRQGQDGSGCYRETNRCACGAVELLPQPPRSSQESDGAYRREGDVECRLLKKTSAAVQHADERRVKTVHQEHQGEDAQRAFEMRSVLELRGERRGAPEDGRQNGGERGVDRERATLRLIFFSRWRAGDRFRHALNRRSGDQVVGDVRDRLHRGECAVAGHADEAREQRLLHHAHHDEPHLRACDRQASTSRPARYICGGGGRKGRDLLRRRTFGRSGLGHAARL